MTKQELIETTGALIAAPSCCQELKAAAQRYYQHLHPQSQMGIAAEPPAPYGNPFISDDNLCIAEAFVKFAVEQGFDFWKEEE